MNLMQLIGASGNWSPSNPPGHGCLLLLLVSQEAFRGGPSLGCGMGGRFRRRIIPFRVCDRRDVPGLLTGPADKVRCAVEDECRQLVGLVSSTQGGFLFPSHFGRGPDVIPRGAEQENTGVAIFNGYAGGSAIFRRCLLKAPPVDRTGRQASFQNVAVVVAGNERERSPLDAP